MALGAPPQTPGRLRRKSELLEPQTPAGAPPQTPAASPQERTTGGSAPRPPLGLRPSGVATVLPQKSYAHTTFFFTVYAFLVKGNNRQFS